HAPMKPESLLAGDPGQQRHGPVPQGHPLLGDAAPDAQDDADALGTGFLAGQFVLQRPVEEAPQFGLVGRLGELVHRRVQPGPLDLAVEAADLPHVPSLAIATNGINPSSRAMPPWATISSPSPANAFRSPASSTCRAGGSPYPGQRSVSGNLVAVSFRN